MESLNEQFGTAAEFEEPKGGIFLWVKLPDNVDTMKLYQPALKAGVAINPGPEWSVDKPHSQEPDAALFRQPDPRRNPQGHRGPRRGLPPRVRRAGAHFQRRAVNWPSSPHSQRSSPAGFMPSRIGTPTIDLLRSAGLGLFVSFLASFCQARNPHISLPHFSIRIRPA